MAATMRVSTDNGATMRPGPMVSVQERYTVTEEQLRDQVASGSNLNGAFLADLLSAAITHERCSVNMLRAMSKMTANPMLGPTYDRFRGQAEQAVQAYTTLIESMGGNPQYVSQSAYLTEAMDGKMVEAFLVSGSVDPLVCDLISVETMMMGAMHSMRTIELMQELMAEIEHQPTKQAMQTACDQLEGPTKQMVDWAKEAQRTMVVTQAKHPMAQKAGEMAESVMGKLKSIVT